MFTSVRSFCFFISAHHVREQVLNGDGGCNSYHRTPGYVSSLISNPNYPGKNALTRRSLRKTMKEPFAPCKNCEKRKLGCHAKCEAYLAYKEKHQIYADLVSGEKEKEITDIEKKRFDKWNKMKQRGVK